MRSKALIALMAVLILSGLSIVAVSGSSHREAPLISENPKADNTDVYAWVDENDETKVNIVANFSPGELPQGGPNYYRFGDEVLYEVHIDNNGDALEDITIQLDFETDVLNGDTFLYNTGPITDLNDPDFNVRQTYSVTWIDEGGATVLGTGLPTPPVNIGPPSTSRLRAAGSGCRTRPW